MDLLFLLYSLLRKKWVIIACTVTGAAAAFIFFMFRPHEYVSLAQYSTGFTMQQQVKIKAEENYNLYEIDIRFSNVTVAFGSDKVLGMLAYKLMLHDLESSAPFRSVKNAQQRDALFTPSNVSKAKAILRDKVARLELLSSYNPDEKMVMDMLGMFGYTSDALMKQLSLDRAGRTDFINIFANSENPHLSAFMANSAGDELIRFFYFIYGNRTTSATVKLDSLLIVKKAIVDSLSDRLKNFKGRIGPITGQEKATAAMSVVTELIGKYQQETKELNRLKAELISVETQLRDIGTVDNGPTTPTYTNNREIMRLRQENSDLELSKNGKSEDEVADIQKKIDANTNKILQLSPARGTDRTSEINRKNIKRDDLISRKVEIEQQIIAAEKNVEQFRREKGIYESMVNNGGDDAVALQIMERDLDIATKEWEQLRSSQQGTLNLQVNPENSFKQTLVGMPADKPSPSRRMIVTGLAGFLMFFFSCFIILLLEFLDSSYKTPTIFQRATKLKLLTSINRIDLKKKELAEYLTPKAEGETVEQRLFIENLRKLRFELENSGKKVFLVTSTRPKEGKSTIIESLANGFSLAHKKVLIIDANFSNNSLSEKFGAKPALEQFSVNGQPNAMDKILSATGATTIPNTDIIGCNEGDYTPSEILPKNHLLESIDKIASRYDYVFIETASLNNHADTKELAKYSDGIIAVFSATSSASQSDKESIEYLRNAGDKLVGAVFNNVQKENMDL